MAPTPVGDRGALVMRHVVAFIMVLAALWPCASRGVNATYTLQDFTTHPISVSRVTVTPLQRAADYAGAVLSSKPLVYTAAVYPTLTNGTITISNLIAGYSYAIAFSDGYGTPPVTNYFPTGLTGTINGRDYTGVIIAQSGGVVFQFAFYYQTNGVDTNAINTLIEAGTANFVDNTNGVIARRLIITNGLQSVVLTNGAVIASGSNVAPVFYGQLIGPVIGNVTGSAIQASYVESGGLGVYTGLISGDGGGITNAGGVSAAVSNDFHNASGLNAGTVPAARLSSANLITGLGFTPVTNTAAGISNALGINAVSNAVHAAQADTATLAPTYAPTNGAVMQNTVLSNVIARGVSNIVPANVAAAINISSNVAIMQVTAAAGANPWDSANTMPGNFDHQLKMGWFGSKIPYLFWYDSAGTAATGTNRSDFIFPDLVNFGDASHMNTNNYLTQQNVYVNGNPFWATNTASLASVDNIFECFNGSPGKYSAISYQYISSTNGAGGVTYSRGPASGVGNFLSGIGYRTNFFIDGYLLPVAVMVADPPGVTANGTAYHRLRASRPEGVVFPLLVNGDNFGTNYNVVLPNQGGIQMFTRTAFPGGTNFLDLQIFHSEPDLGPVIYGSSNRTGGGSLVLKAQDDNAQIRIRSDPVAANAQANAYLNYGATLAGGGGHNFYGGGAYPGVLKLRVGNDGILSPQPVFIASNGYPAAPISRGDCAIWVSNGYPFILLTTNAIGGVAGAAAVWTGTNRLGW